MRKRLGKGNQRKNELYKKLQETFKDVTDFYIREIPAKNNQFFIAYIKGLVDSKVISEFVIKPIMEADEKPSIDQMHSLTYVNNIRLSKDYDAITNALRKGNSVLFSSESDECLILGTPGWKNRDIREPQAESTIRGSHQGFIENLKINLGLFRRYVPDRNLKTIQLTLGKRSQTQACLVFLEDIADEDLVKEMLKRLEGIQIDAVLNTGEIQDFIEDSSITLFPQFLITERPDTTASAIYQGKIALFIDHSPGVLIGPHNFSSFLQSVDDYSIRWLPASFIRVLRYVSFFVAIFLPSLYIATLSFHYELLPLDLIISVGESRERVPIPPILEAIFMEIVIEVLREAGLRLPSPISQTVGIVGGIVIGQAAVEAGIVSNIMVIVVALTAIASFIIPSQDMSSGIRLFRFPIMVLAALYGMIGVVIGLMIIVAHFVSLETLGTPYSNPLAPTRLRDWKDFIIRLPMQKMKSRPTQARANDQIRQSKGDK
ncbi:MAG: spore germination protein [Bacillaceae bacterium]|nr:spore germination protein [Bacillaceae bacterium]